MSTRQHISRKASLESNFTPTVNPLKTRGFGKGIQARSAELPKTNPLQTRPFGSPIPASAQQEETESASEQLDIESRLGYNGLDVPVNAPEPPPQVQRKEALGGFYQPLQAPQANPGLNRLNPLKVQPFSQQETVQRKETSLGEELPEQLEAKTLEQQSLSDVGGEVLQRSPATNMISKQEASPNKTREQKLKKYHAAISQRDWEYAAIILNGFNEADIRALVKKLNFADRVKMKNGALKRMSGWPEIVTKIIDEHNKDTQKRTINFNGTSREEKALKRLQNYAVKFPKGPLTKAPDNDFGTRLQAAITDLKAEIEQAKSFKEMPGRLKAIVFAAEELNSNPLNVSDKEWMTTNGSTKGGRNPHRSGSTSSYGENSWKCNKFVADAYASTEGAGIRTNYPLGKDNNNNWWGPQANELASGRYLKNFPLTELVKLAQDGTTITEVDEYNKMGQVTAKYKLDGKVFKKYEKKGKDWIETKQTKNPDDIEPGQTAYIGDIVAFENVDRSVSGHTGLNLGHDLFISALNATSGVGILSIKMHLDPNQWDQYNQVAFRSYSL